VSLVAACKNEAQHRSVQKSAEARGKNCLSLTATALPPTWNTGVSSIFQNKCNTCHANSAGKPVVYSTYQIAKANLSNIISSINSGKMPKTPTTLTGDEMLTLANWITAGYPENQTSGFTQLPTIGTTTSTGTVADPNQAATSTSNATGSTAAGSGGNSSAESSGSGYKSGDCTSLPEPMETPDDPSASSDPSSSNSGSTSSGKSPVVNPGSTGTASGVNGSSLSK
jgi:hypothetical protein